MSEPQIGQWVKREGPFRRHRSDPEKWVGPRWHLVESIVARAAVTRCGNTMQWRDSRSRELQVSEVMPLTRMIGQPHLCKAGCDAQAKKDLVETLLEDGERDRALVAAWDSTLPAIEDDPSTSPVDPVTGMP